MFSDLKRTVVNYKLVVKTQKACNRTRIETTLYIVLMLQYVLWAVTTAGMGLQMSLGPIDKHNCQESGAELCGIFKF